MVFQSGMIFITTMLFVTATDAVTMCIETTYTGKSAYLNRLNTDPTGCFCAISIEKLKNNDRGQKSNNNGKNGNNGKNIKVTFSLINLSGCGYKLGISNSTSDSYFDCDSNKTLGIFYTITKQTIIKLYLEQYRDKTTGLAFGINITSQPASNLTLTCQPPPPTTTSTQITSTTATPPQETTAPSTSPATTSPRTPRTTTMTMGTVLITSDNSLTSTTPTSSVNSDITTIESLTTNKTTETPQKSSSTPDNPSTVSIFNDSSGATFPGTTLTISGIPSSSTISSVSLSQGQKQGNFTSEVVGCVIGGLVIIAIVIVIVCLLLRRRKKLAKENGLGDSFLPVKSPDVAPSVHYTLVRKTNSNSSGVEVKNLNSNNPENGNMIITPNELYVSSDTLDIPENSRSHFSNQESSLKPHSQPEMEIIPNDLYVSSDSIQKPEAESTLNCDKNENVCKSNPEMEIIPNELYISSDSIQEPEGDSRLNCDKNENASEMEIFPNDLYVSSDAIPNWKDAKYDPNLNPEIEITENEMYESWDSVKQKNQLVHQNAVDMNADDDHYDSVDDSTIEVQVHKPDSNAPHSDVDKLDDNLYDSVNDHPLIQHKPNASLPVQQEVEIRENELYESVDDLPKNPEKAKSCFTIKETEGGRNDYEEIDDGDMPQNKPTPLYYVVCPDHQADSDEDGSVV